MNIIFYGGRQAGIVSLLTLMALGHKIACVIPVDDSMELVANGSILSIKKPKNINEKKFIDYLKTLNADLFVCCHGRQIIKSLWILNKLKAINMHPCLYKYKGADPIKRLLEDKSKKASVGVHWMTEKVDEGMVITEHFKEIISDTTIGVYNELYPLYATSLIEALRKISPLLEKNDIRTRKNTGIYVTRNKSAYDVL